MSKRTFMTNITPLPRNVSRDVATAMLHDHEAMIHLNPLVLRHQDSNPPSNASPDEVKHATWYEITDRINYLPGGVMRGEVTYKACFYDLPAGLQTHVFAPAGVDIRSKWTIGGNVPGEPRAPQELGVNVPRDVLYIKEEVDLRCNIFMSKFVRQNLKRSHLVVADKMAQKAQANHLHMKPPGHSAPIRSKTDVQSTNSTLSRESDIVRESRSRSEPNSPEAPGPIHWSYLHPLRCACGEPSHKLNCPLYDSYGTQDSPEQSDQGPLSALTARQGEPAPETPMTSPSATSARDVSLHELLGSPSPNGCLCTGGLHEEACHSYPGLRTIRPESHSRGPVSQHSDSQSEGAQAPRRSHSVASSQRPFRSFSRRDINVATTSYFPRHVETADRDLVPSPLQTRADI